MTVPSLRKRAGSGILLSLGLLLFIFSACSSDSDKYDAYANWRARNAEWFEQIADSARRNADGQWLMLKNFSKSPTFQSGITADSICVHIIRRGTGTARPTFSDSVRVNFRGWLMPTQTEDGQREELTFTQTYYGDFNSQTASPQLAAVSSFMDGFSTALQHMVVGDDWWVYIPQQLFYGETANGIIPAYSTVRFRLQLMGVYPLGTKVPEWK